MKIGFEAVENVSAMLQRSTNLTYVYVKQEMVRFGLRFRKRMKNERMHGRPGINAPRFSRIKDKNLSSWTKGNSISSLTTSARITRILKVHEEGATIVPKKGEYLIIRGKDGKIFARARRVVVPARLGFMSMWREVVPDEKERIKAAMQRAMQVASERNVKQLLKSN